MTRLNRPNDRHGNPDQSAWLDGSGSAGRQRPLRAVDPGRGYVVADVVTSQIDLALALWSRGLSIIPVPRPDSHGHNGKVPVIAWREYQTRRPTEHEIHAWFDGRASNIAIVTGAVSGVVVIDVDSRPAMEWAVIRLPYTPWQSTTGRGYHLYYQHPGARVPNRARIETRDGRFAMDVRGDGGYVIAPGSVHVNGTEYREAGDWTRDRDELPRFWAGWLARPRRPALRRRCATPSTGDVIDRARRYLAAIPVPEIGAGSDSATLSAACRLVRGFELPLEDAEALLWEWAGSRPGWTREWIAEKVRHAERYGTEPIGALR
jgi:Bifunctional DNA primase/polymerase, N-terminal